METIRYSNFKNYFKKIKELREDKASFKVEKTGSTSIITINGLDSKPVIKIMYATEYTPLYILPLMKKIKKEIHNHEKNVLEADISFNPLDCQYFEFKPSLYEMKMEQGSIYEFSNVFEADISFAYYKTALNLGFISEELYNECLLLDKRHRLKVLGSIATSKTVYIYEDGKIKDSLVMEDKLTRLAWFKICTYVNNTMQQIKNVFQENFIFYWVDGIYLTNVNGNSDEDEETIINEFELYAKTFNFDWKIVKLEKIEIANINDSIKVLVYKGGKPKEFTLPKRKVKYYGMGTDKEFQQI